MDGSLRSRRRGSARPPQAEPSPPATASIREAAIPQRPSKKICHGMSSTSSTLSVSHVWADLTDSLIHQIIALLVSFHDFLAFRGTCRSWRVAASSFPSVYTFTFPPLHLTTDFRHTKQQCNRGEFSLLRNCKWLLGDHAKRNLSLRCSVPRNSPNCLSYLGCSYGYLIFSYREHCLLVDVYTGTKVKPPKIKSNSDLKMYNGILVAPLNSPDSCLLLCSRTSMFQWQVGTNSWSEHPLGVDGDRILQLVLFKGQIFYLGVSHKLYVIQLEPQFSIQEVEVSWGEEMDVCTHDRPWLVSFGDTLLMLVLSVTRDDFDASLSGTFQVFRLDFSVEPAKWVKMQKLVNCALFVSIDRRTPTFSCMSPERWGGKSNSIYIPSASEDSDEPWTPVELGETLPAASVLDRFLYGHCPRLQNLWVFPSLVYGAGQ